MARKTVEFRLIEESDAAFVYQLRTDPRYNEHLSAVTGSIEDQREWIGRYKLREAEGSECYYIIFKLEDATPVGTVRLYDFRGDKESFSWGSWILNENKTRLAAVESAMIVYRIGFDELGFKSCHFEVRKGNDRVISFHTKFGAVQTGEDELNYYFTLSPATYAGFLEKNRALLQSD